MLHVPFVPIFAVLLEAGSNTFEGWKSAESDNELPFSVTEPLWLGWNALDGFNVDVHWTAEEVQVLLWVDTANTSLVTGLLDLNGKAE